MENSIESGIIEDEQYKNLFVELSEYERMGVRMKMNGHPASPLQIASAHAVKEELSYMRDYVADLWNCQIQSKNALIPLYAENR